MQCDCVCGPLQLMHLPRQSRVLIDVSDPTQEVDQDDECHGHNGGQHILSQADLRGDDRDAKKGAEDQQQVCLRHQGDLEATAEEVHGVGGQVFLAVLVRLRPYAAAKAAALDPPVVLDLSSQRASTLEALHLLHGGLDEGNLIFLQPLEHQGAHRGDGCASVELPVENNLVGHADRVDGALLEELQPSPDEGAEGRHGRPALRPHESLRARRDVAEEFLE
mmetsp:Transcript_60744/g.170191  ORF Transcript_60744/g.170191 Transcript_60744/m.170191 type:complete len:221 (+) Transcript_60744:1037-1699(+)